MLQISISIEDRPLRFMLSVTGHRSAFSMIDAVPLVKVLGQGCGTIPTMAAALALVGWRVLGGGGHQVHRVVATALCSLLGAELPWPSTPRLR